ncbi:MAG TPA: hypothetical protein VE987_20950, partial [Polyangiaceae bacterium]|nr:hypothetical protein [Polyangiaceae bacterium]
MRARFASAAAVLLAGCSGARPPASAEPARWDYAVVAPPPGSWRLEVEATIERAATARLVAPEAQAAMVDLRLVDAGGARAL